MQQKNRFYYACLNGRDYNNITKSSDKKLLTRSIFYKKQRKIQTSHVSYFFEIFDGFCFLEIEKSWFFVS